MLGCVNMCQRVLNNFSIEAVWNALYQMHLYNTKTETFFKASFITVSWIGGGLARTDLSCDENAISYYLFSIALIMEYAVSLFLKKKFISKIPLFIIVVLNLLVFFFTTSVIVNQPISYINGDWIFWFVFVSMLIIWFDMLTILLFEPYHQKPIEEQLKEI